MTDLRPLPFENIIVDYGVKDIFLFETPNLKTVTLPDTLVHLSVSFSSLPIGTNIPNSLQSYDIDISKYGVTNFMVPASSQSVYVRIAEGSTITLQNKFKGKITIDNEDCRVPEEYTIIYPGTFNEFRDNVELYSCVISDSLFRNTTIECSDGIATWDRCIKTPVLSNSGYDYIPVFSIK